MSEKRVDPEDGESYTFDEISTFYKGKYKKSEVKAYWEDTCKPVKAKGKGKAKAEAEPKGKAKAKTKAKAKAEAEPKGKAKAKTKAKAKAEAEPKGKAKTKAKAKAKAKAEPEPKATPDLGKPAGPGQSRSGRPVNVAALMKVTKDDLGLMPQPLKPRFKTALVGIYVRSAPGGGTDKSSNGQRYDSIPFANGVIAAGMSCQLINYVHEEHNTFFEVVKAFDALIVRCNPGQIKADGGSQEKFDDSMRALRKQGCRCGPPPT
jgi:hypothetical protein